MTAPRIVLCRPQTGENVGFVVRLCANFEVPELVVVAPATDWRERAARTASMCPERLAQVRVVAELPDALADCTQVFGFTARGGRERPVAPLSELAPTERPATPTALLFGNEESGLDADEIVPCTRLFRIEVPGLGSLNLSHAVAIALHVWSESPSTGERELPSLMTVEERTRLAERARRVLIELGFRTDDPHFEGSLARLVLGTALEARDGRMAHRILRHLEYLREHPGGG